jgi:hypothetical protein
MHLECKQSRQTKDDSQESQQLPWMDSIEQKSSYPSLYSTKNKQFKPSSKRWWKSILMQEIFSRYCDIVKFKSKAYKLWECYFLKNVWTLKLKIIVHYISEWLSLGLAPIHNLNTSILHLTSLYDLIVTQYSFYLQIFLD